MPSTHIVFSEIMIKHLCSEKTLTFSSLSGYTIATLHQHNCVCILTGQLGSRAGDSEKGTQKRDLTGVNLGLEGDFGSRVFCKALHHQ